MLVRGVYPASVTPFSENGDIDYPSIARLLAFFEGAGCQGVVLGGTNGEGPSLSAIERRDLLRQAVPLAGSLQLIQGIATNSLTEAIWLSEQAGKAGATALLVLPPSYFRSASEAGLRAWFWELLSASPVPILIYNFPKMTGFSLTPAWMESMAEHPQFAGIKDSSGSTGNLPGYRSAVGQDHALFVGDEALLLDALQAGWTGSISGAANVIPQWLSRIVYEWDQTTWRESAETKFAILSPVIQAIRSADQPATHKAILRQWGIIDQAEPRLPLLPPGQESVRLVAKEILDRLGIGANQLGLSPAGH